MALPPPSPDATALVTGASSGIGVELARRAGRAGARRHPGGAGARHKLSALAAELGQAHGVHAEVVALDLTDAPARAGLPDTLAERGLTVDVLVNNAGFSTTGPVYRSDRAREITMIRTDVEAVADLCSIFVPGMVERGRGRGAQRAPPPPPSSLFPVRPGTGRARPSCLSYTRSVRAELRDTGVTVTVLCPGPVKTEFAESAGFTPEESKDRCPSSCGCRPPRSPVSPWWGWNRARAW